MKLHLQITATFLICFLGCAGPSLEQNTPTLSKSSRFNNQSNLNRGIIPVPIIDSAGNTVGLYNESHALLVGVSDYEGLWPTLSGVISDIKSVKKVLELLGFSVEIIMNPTREELNEAFVSFIDRYGHAEKNRLLFYFAGHGHTIVPQYGGTEMGFIVPRGAPNPNIDKRGFLRQAMSMQNIEVYARAIQSKHALFVFDSCFAGSIFATSRSVPQIIKEKTGKPVRQFIAAGRANQSVPDESIFRRQFVRAFNGDGDLNQDGYITGSELGQFLENVVANYSKGSQVPQYGKLRDAVLDQGDFVFPISIGDRVTKVTNRLKEKKQNLEEKQKEELMKQEKLLQELALLKRELQEEIESVKQSRKKTDRINQLTRIEIRKKLQDPIKYSLQLPENKAVKVLKVKETECSANKCLNVRLFCKMQSGSGWFIKGRPGIHLTFYDKDGIPKESYSESKPCFRKGDILNLSMDLLSETPDYTWNLFIEN
jgi:hypothetical protein